MVTIMSHMIIKPVDRVFSVEGPEWHQMAEVKSAITKLEADPLFFDIVEGCPVIPIEGEQVKLEGWKALLADMRNRPDVPDAFVPLHIPREGYTVVKNEEVWDALETALEGVDHKISTVGTLGEGKRFFVSVELGDTAQFNVNGDDFEAYLNFVTSHDGMMAVNAYDSMVRIVCQNTLDWSLSSAGDVGFKVFHTKGANLAVQNMGDLVNRILTGREEFIDRMKFLADQACSEIEARELTAGWFGRKKKSNEDMSTRMENTIDGIVDLFQNGQGNEGKTLYDLMNGATEYYTSGDGVGKSVSMAKRVSNARFGTASRHKSEFTSFLLSGDSTLAKYRDHGKKLLTPTV